MLRNMVSGVFSSALDQYGHCTYFEVGLRRMLFMVSRENEEEQQEQRILEAVEKRKFRTKAVSGKSICHSIPLSPGWRERMRPLLCADE